MADAPKKMSNAGAQDKLAVVVRENELFQPVGDAVSTHLLKPGHIDREHYPDTVANEYFVMRLAARLGLDVPAVSMRFVPDPVYLIERFDRATRNGRKSNYSTGGSRLAPTSVAATSIATMSRCATMAPS